MRDKTSEIKSNGSLNNFKKEIQFQNLLLRLLDLTDDNNCKKDNIVKLKNILI